MRSAKSGELDVRTVLRDWSDEARASGRFVEWTIEYEAGGSWPGAGVHVMFLSEAGVGQLSAWPSGYIDTEMIAASGDNRSTEHFEVVSVEELLQVARSFTDELLAIRN